METTFLGALLGTIMYLLAWYLIGVISSLLIYKMEEKKVRVRHIQGILKGGMFGLLALLVLCGAALGNLLLLIKVKTPKIKFFDKEWLKTNGEKVLW